MCTRVMWADNGLAVITGRSLDWMEDMGTNLWAFPRGMSRDGLDEKNALTWTSKFGSLTASAYDIAISDGINERGLGVHLLWLAEGTYGKRDTSLPGLSVGLWAQLMLDTCATVADVVALTESTSFQILPAYHPGTGLWVTVHLAVEDPSGDSAIIEYFDGKPVIHHGREFTVMTNSPPYDQQLEHLRQFEGLGGSLPLPGTADAADRFVRAAYYVTQLPPPTSEREAIAEMLSVMRDVSQPFGTTDPARPNISATRWRTVSDLTNRIYFFESTTSPNVFWTFMDNLDFSEGMPTLKLDLVNQPDLVGDVTPHYVPTAPFTPIRPTAPS
jgi:penicillin V acylase-like amidase (Ntn superfamily)